MASTGAAVGGRVSTAAVTWGIARRSLMLIPRVPSTFIPSLIMPVFLLVAFTGAFGNLTRIPGFETAEMINWMLPMAAIMGASFAGVTTGIGVARDLETGFFDRLLLSPSSRVSLLTGPMIAGVLRSFLPLTLTLLVGIAWGLDFVDGPAALGMLAIATTGVSLSMAAWSTALALRIKSQAAAAPLMQVGVFVLVFLSTAQMPLALLHGWLHPVARWNPMTHVFELARQGFLGEVSWASTWPGLVSLAGLAAGLFLFALAAVRKVVP